MGVLILAMLAGGTVLLMTPMVIKLGQRFDWVDHPDSRKHHQTAMVRVGGLAIFIGMMFAFGGLFILGRGASLSATTLALVLGSIASFGIGFADDLFGLSPRLRLLSQAAMTVGLWYAGIQIEALPFPFLGQVPLGWLSIPITFLWLAGVTNAINWLDGMDGLAAGIGAISSLVLALGCYQVGAGMEATIALSLAATLLGFLVYNARPAKLFMGDGGAYLIGFLLASLPITSLIQGQTASVAVVPDFILCIPILDMIYVIVKRLLDRKSPFYPDRRHLHHRFLQQGFSYNQTLWHIYGLVLFTGALGITITGGIPWLGIPIGLSSLAVWIHRQPLKTTWNKVLRSSPIPWKETQTAPSSTIVN